ncbi:hypothetical protein IMG5_137930 [Ichthyophthirius multifiliis]|uniref:diacylglycerol O-acyltransferase n=1 Tax=Ichthyophthirius multifiliis TaxID=5932 RepID=G0QX47_ICHMU|nr:hypothetical protein IMG5_137930 [Ichthyophthirius multifiliis]EGR30204.1 hypothetical protein IMG5_137930 [Ichthyophthirius multifiliis]|eukprot:XP_004031800.1 hypothetical protein IMG5_137930 [Ichthyophthirius multifiliis]
MAMALLLNMYRKEEPLSQVVFCGSRVALQMPLAGYLIRWSGLVSADPQSFQSYMQKGKNICFIPGGYEEASLTSQNQYNYYLEHKGFIKYAMKYGYKIRPCVAYNENKAYQTIDKFYKFRLLLNKFKFVGTLFYSKYFLILSNPNINIEMVVAKPFEVPQIENPTKEQIEEWHKKYIEYVTQIFYKYKNQFDSKGGDLYGYQNEQLKQLKPKL